MKPSKHKMTVLSQIFKLIPRNLIPKLANEFGIDRQSRVFSPTSHVLALVEPLSSPCRAWRQNGQTVSAGYECPGQRGFISWWLASRLSTGTDGGVNVRNLCTPVTRA